MTTTAFLQSALATEGTIFSRQRIAHSPPHPITHAVASNFQVVLVLANKSLQRINQATKKSEGGSPVETLDFSKLTPNTKVSFVSLDPTGSHFIISLRPTDPEGQPETLYLSRRSKKFRNSARLRGHLVTAVAWCARNVSDTQTGPILIGTSKGLIFETEFDSGEDKMFSSSLEKHWKQVLSLGKGQHLPICGLAYYNVAGTRKYFALVTTANRLYQFQGQVTTHEDRPLLLNIFTADSSVLEKFLELPSNLKNSVLQFSYQTKERGKPFAKHPLNPVSFGWMTEPGLYAGRIEPDVVNPGDSVTIDCELIQFPGGELQNKNGSPRQVPICFLLTEFHAIFVYGNAIKGICLLNQQVMFHADFDPGEGNIKGIAGDPFAGSFYVFSDYVVHKFKVTREDRNVWKIYLDKGDFNLAMLYSKNDEAKMNQVLAKQADDLFKKGKYVESAMHFAKTHCSFEEISLKFMQIEEKTALQNFLKKRLETVRSSEVTQLTLIVVWLIENYLSVLRILENEGKTEEYEKMKGELLRLIKTNKVSNCIDQSRSTVYDLLAKHGDKTTLIEFATLMNDYDRVIQYHLQNNDYEAALSVLQQQRKPTLFHQYGPDLMPVLPKLFVDLLIDQGNKLGNPALILPSFVVCSSPDQELQAIKYLEFAINVLNRRDPALHNLLISLYVKHQEDKIENYLNSQGFNPEEIPYDIEYTLRLFEENGLKRASLILYCILGQLLEAVDIGLDIDLDHAEKTLNFATNDEDRRKIWLRIAKDVVTRKRDIGQAMNYLKKSNNLINIEDILPFFPDFVTIDHFKEAVCEALERYSNHIENLQRDMEESNEAADRIRSEIQGYKDRYIFVRAVDTCAICNLYLMSKPFHLFNCSHKFHTECLIKEVIPYLSKARGKKVEELRSEILKLENNNNNNVDTLSTDSKSTKLSKKDQLKSELDDLIASECFYCSELMVRMVDKPLIGEEDFDQTISEWL